MKITVFEFISTILPHTLSCHWEQIPLFSFWTNFFFLLSKLEFTHLTSLVAVLGILTQRIHLSKFNLYFYSPPNSLELLDTSSQSCFLWVGGLCFLPDAFRVSTLGCLQGSSPRHVQGFLSIPLPLLSATNAPQMHTAEWSPFLVLLGFCPPGFWTFFLSH